MLNLFKFFSSFDPETGSKFNISLKSSFTYHVKNQRERKTRSNNGQDSISPNTIRGIQVQHKRWILIYCQQVAFMLSLSKKLDINKNVLSKTQRPARL